MILLCRVVEGEESVGGVLLGRIVRIIYKGELQKKKEIAYQQKHVMQERKSTRLLVKIGRGHEEEVDNEIIWFFRAISPKMEVMEESHRKRIAVSLMM